METTVEEHFEDVDDLNVQQGMFGKTYVNLYSVAEWLLSNWPLRVSPKDFFGAQHSGSSSLIKNKNVFVVYKLQSNGVIDRLIGIRGLTKPK